MTDHIHYLQTALEMTEEELEANCYPMPDPTEKGKAIVKEDPFR